MKKLDAYMRLNHGGVYDVAKLIGSVMILIMLAYAAIHLFRLAEEALTIAGNTFAWFFAWIARLLAR